MHHLDEQPSPPRVNVSVAQQIIGVITRPILTLRQVAAMERWQWAVGIFALYELIQLLITFNSDTLELEFSKPLFIVSGVAIGIPIGILYFLFLTFIIKAIGVRLGGKDNYIGLVAARGFAIVILYFGLPLRAYTLSVGESLTESLALVLYLATLAILFWAIVAEVIAIRESLSISTGSAILTSLAATGITLLISFLLPPLAMYPI